ncbi:MAG: hypothetical protein ABL998_12685, partial [Planctomycetota bacterium]
MRNSIAFAAAFLASVPSIHAQKELASSAPPAEVATSASEAPREFVARGDVHRLIVPAGHALVRGARNAEIELYREDYGSFVLLELRVPSARDLATLLARGAQLVDHQSLVALNGYLLDGADAETTRATRAALPPLLRTDPAAEERLELVQFRGPIKDEWRASLEQTGAFVVAYVPHNAYVVKSDARAHAALAALAGKPYVLGVSDYEPAFKLRPTLRDAALALGGIHDVIVQVVADARGEAFADALEARALAVLQPRERVLDY